MTIQRMSQSSIKDIESLLRGFRVGDDNPFVAGFGQPRDRGEPDVLDETAVTLEERSGHFLHNHVDPVIFAPDALRTLIAAFDDAWQPITASGAKLSNQQSELRGNYLQKYIIEQACQGKLDDGCRHDRYDRDRRRNEATVGIGPGRHGRRPRRAWCPRPA
jgi:hypothetical protein